MFIKFEVEGSKLLKFMKLYTPLKQGGVLDVVLQSSGDVRGSITDAIQLLLCSLISSLVGLICLASSILLKLCC